ncbi:MULTISPECIES: hypothetical protein [Rhodomicrobium]|uniref:hypothetical protein n=1 Tax=Rhodomicrobium TaxID=1068 RepID=UPI000F743256|nr:MULTISPECIES: hypothetical protein [Rhodomicrobium]
MKRLDVIKLFELGSYLGAAERIMDQRSHNYGDVFVGLMPIRDAFYEFAKGQHTFDLVKTDALNVSKKHHELVTAHFYNTEPGKAAIFKDELDFSAEFPTWALNELKEALSVFKSVFSAECRKCETYFIGNRKLGYDIETLLHYADHRVHESIRPLVPTLALEELRLAGRCLALESYTASGFHTLRALEVVMAEYHSSASQSPREFKSWNDYIIALDDLTKSDPSKKYPSRKVIAMLDRIRQLDRNPLMHPRDSLDEMGADNLFGIGIATITEMVKDMREMNQQPQLKLLQNNHELEGQAEAS